MAAKDVSVMGKKKLLDEVKVFVQDKIESSKCLQEVADFYGISTAQVCKASFGVGIGIDTVIAILNKHGKELRIEDANGND